MAQYPWLIYIDSAISIDRERIKKDIEHAFRKFERISNVRIPRKIETMVGKDTLLEVPFEQLLHNITSKNVLVNGELQEVSIDDYLNGALHVHNDMLLHEKRMPSFGNLRCNYSYTHILSLAVIKPYVMSRVGNLLVGNAAPIRGKRNTADCQLEWNFEHGAGATLSLASSNAEDYEAITLGFASNLEHELAHTYGVGHCNDEECIMLPYALDNTQVEVNQDFCEKDEAKLKDLLRQTY